MIDVAQSLKDKAQKTADQMNAAGIDTANIEGAEGFVLIKCGSKYVCPSNSTLQVKIGLAGGNEYLLCEGRAETVLAQNN